MQPCLFCGGDASEPDHLLRCDGRQGRREALEARPYVPYQPASETSEAAADALPDDCVRTLREQVYRCIRDSGDGMTDDDIQAALGLDGSTERPRRVELLHLHRIVDSGARRATRSGRQAVVWRC